MLTTGWNSLLVSFVSSLFKEGFKKLNNETTDPKMFAMYRSLQILESQINICCKDFFLSGLLIIVSAVFVLSLFVCIKLNQAIPLPGFLFFPLALFDVCIIILVEYTTAALIWKRSSELLILWKKQSKHKTMFKATLKSLSPFKIKFGMNFVDSLTPLVILDFCINQTASMLLIM